MNLTRQSNVEKALRGTPDSLLHNSITPPFLIRKQNGRSAAEEEAPEEVLVDSQDLVAPEEPTEEVKKEEVSDKKKEEEGEKKEGNENAKKTEG